MVPPIPGQREVGGQEATVRGCPWERCRAGSHRRADGARRGGEGRLRSATRISYEELLKVFWENHDPTQGMRQQEDLGTQYRSVIYTLGPQQRAAALRSRAAYHQVGGDTGTPLGTLATSPSPRLWGKLLPWLCHAMGQWVGGGPSRLPPTMGLSQELREQQRGDITTAIEPAGDFYYAEDGHQQYLHKVPGGSCVLKGTGVTCPITP
ncbi:hypothetical protein QYF61_001321 [Mycteria americana]|uniref:peptide-methionine (S)-S-oxide reductase n=1 Tax=Mycteria americana TaxID=33587 RepID=A0AAN7MFH6_MYCAM|nr:hypothetical protein QYF61_001321 [Mycteria americana]